MHSELDFSVLDPASAVLTLRPDLRFTPAEFDTEACYMIEDPVRGKFFRIGSDEFSLISLLDGKNTIAQAIGLSAATLRERAFTENEAMSVCHWLLESQLAVCGGAGQAERLAESARKQAQNKLAAVGQSLGHAGSTVKPQPAARITSFPGRIGCTLRPPWWPGASSA